MAPVKKGAKINFYKFVSVEKPSSGIGRKDKVEAQKINAINNNTKALNNIGAVLNGMSQTLSNISTMFGSLVSGIQEQAKPKFVPRYATPSQVDEVEGTGGGFEKTRMPGFFDALFGLIKDLLFLAIAKPLFDWISNPENRKKVVNMIETIANVIKTITGFLTDRVTGLLENLAGLMDPDKPWWEKMGNLLGAIVDFAGLFVAIRWLKDPTKIITDITSVFGLLGKQAAKTKASLLKTLGVAGVVAGVAILATAQPAGQGSSITSAMDAEGRLPGDDGFDKSTAGQVSIETLQRVRPDLVEDRKAELGQFSRGGRIPQRAMGGWINGPMSGYPVSLTGNGVDFIGHGLEYVAQKAAGGFVIPFNTPSTKTNPGLTAKRISEATSMGFNLPQFATGGPVPNTGQAEKTTNRGTDTAADNAGLPAVIAVGKALLQKGFTVAEHPYFRKNNHQGSGPNLTGYNAQGNSRVGSHSPGSAHYKGLAIDVTDWRGGDWKGRTRTLAKAMYEQRNKLMLSQIIHDPWGSWFAGGSKGGGIGGHDTHLHLAFKKAKLSTAAMTPVQPKSPLGPQQSGGAVAAYMDPVKSMGFSSADWDLYRNTVAHIESKGKYKIQGGSGNHYDGRYQLGEAAKKDAARYLGIPFPGHDTLARQKFINDPAMQEKFFSAFTLANHKYLMGNSEYRAANNERKLQILGYAHNQGMGGAENWMRTGQVGKDGFGTKGTAYTDAIAAEFKRRNGLVGKSKAPKASGIFDFTTLFRGPQTAPDSSNVNSENNASDLTPPPPVNEGDSPDSSSPSTSPTSIRGLLGEFEGLFRSSTGSTGVTTPPPASISPATKPSSVTSAKQTQSSILDQKAVQRQAANASIQAAQVRAISASKKAEVLSAQAQQTLADAQSAANNKKPTLATTGTTKTNMVDQLNSENNPLK